MIKSFTKTTIFLKTASETLTLLPSPKTITYMWNIGSLLGIIFVLQFLTGFLVSIFYTARTITAFDSLVDIIRETNYGWLVRLVHLNGASLFFIFVYLHMLRGIIYSSFRLAHTWNSGVRILLLLMGIAFLGYVLPWGQISLWGATVITNLLSTIPIWGQDIVKWVWGGFSVGKRTLNCFYSLHFLLPFVLMGLIIFHIFSLHETGSSSPINTFDNLVKIKFDNYFTSKDIINLIVILFFIFLTLTFPWATSDPENFIKANPAMSPLHIQPEWYFLFAYAILRSIPNKLGGVVALALRVILLYILPVCFRHFPSKLMWLWLPMVWTFVMNFLLLTWIGGQPVEYPYILLGQAATVLYFRFILLISPIINVAVNITFYCVW